jgi:hypothetical protein
MLGISRRSSLKRRLPPLSVITTNTLHLSPTRWSRPLIVRQTGLFGLCAIVGYLDVPSAQICSSGTEKCVLAAVFAVVI